MIRHILAQKRTDTVFLYGVSLGGNIATNIVAEEEFSETFKAAAIIQPSLDLGAAVHNLSVSLWGFYDFWFMKCLYVMHERVGSIPMFEQTFNSHSRKYGYGIDVKEFWAKTWFAGEMSRKYTQMIYEMDDVNAAYKKYSSIDRVQTIKTPTLMLKSEDDPVVGDKAIDEVKILANPNMLLVKTKYGGHLGYYETITAKD